MASTTDTFNVSLKRFAKALEIDLGLLMKRVTIDMSDRIVIRTPVDTGRARSSWNIGIGEVDLSVIKEDVIVPRKGSALIRKQQAKLESLDPRDTVFISNNLDYIEKLEFGSSQKAPNGMVRITVAEVKAELRARANS